MKIQKLKFEKEYSLISVEEHLDLLRSKFNLVRDANGSTEPMSVAESVTMMSHDILESDLSEGVMLNELAMLYKQAHNYMELLHQRNRQKQEEEVLKQENNEITLG